MNDIFKNIILRADGNGEIGYGHLSRLNALANIIGEEFKVIFLTRHDSNISLIESNIEIAIIPKEVDLINESDWIYKNFSPNNNFIVADGYQFSSSYQKKIKNLGYRLMFIDDLMKFHMHADYVINHAIGLKESQYSGEKYVKYFLGSEYALLRNSFIERSKLTKEKVLKFETAFVCFGGTNSSKITMSAVNSLLNFKNFKKIYVVVGKSFTDISQIEFLKENVRTELFVDIGEKVISKIMSYSDFAIVPSSTISYELASSRCIIASGFTTENQLNIYKGLRNKNIIFGLGDISNFEEKDFNLQLKTILISEKEVYQAKIKNQIKYFDGNQKERYKKILNSLF
jgi:UDP-2,4-diacetamido-2,4,6-trideoxy-beta-L-altropyranose hydrolase